MSQSMMPYCGEDLALEKAIIGDNCDGRTGHSIVSLTLQESCNRGEILYMKRRG